LKFLKKSETFWESRSSILIEKNRNQSPAQEKQEKNKPFQKQNKTTTTTIN